MRMSTEEGEDIGDFKDVHEAETRNDTKAKNRIETEAPQGATRPSKDSGDVFGDYHNGNAFDNFEAGEEDDVFGDFEDFEGFEVAMRARSLGTLRTSTWGVILVDLVQGQFSYQIL